MPASARSNLTRPARPRWYATASADPPRPCLGGWRKPLPAMLLPLMFHVVTRAPSKRLRARSIGSPAAFSLTTNHERERFRALTRTTRATLTPLCLGNDAAHDPEHLSSYRKPRGVWSADRCFQTRLSTRDPETPRTRSLSRSWFPATARQSCLGSARARPAVLAYLSVTRNQRARDASGRRLQSTCQRREPDDLARRPDSSSRGPSTSPEDGAKHTATARFGLGSAAWVGVFVPLWHATKP